MGRYADPPEPPARGGNMRPERLTRRDLETSMIMFGFHDVYDFAGFIADQHEKIST